MSVANKRQNCSNYAWKIEIGDIDPLRKMVTAAHTILRTAVFKVQKCDDKYVLMLDGADQSMTCLITSRLVVDFVDIKGSDTSIEFCIEMKVLNIALGTGHYNHGVLTLTQTGDKIHAKLNDPDNRSHCEETELNTYEDTPMKPRWSAIDFKMTVEIDVGRLKTTLAMAQKYDAEHIRFRLYLFKNKGQDYSTVHISTKGIAKYSQLYTQPISAQEDSSIVVRSVPDGTEEDECHVAGVGAVFDGKFSKAMIESFVKPLQCKMIVAQVMDGKPMLLSHPLCGETDPNSYLRFLIAQKKKSDDDDDDDEM